MAGISTPAPRVFNKSRSPPPRTAPNAAGTPESPEFDKHRFLESKKVDRRGKPDMPWLKKKKKVSPHPKDNSNAVESKGAVVVDPHKGRVRAKTRDGRESGRESKLSSEVQPERIQDRRDEINSSIDLRNTKKKQAPPRRPTFKRFKTQTRDRSGQVLSTNKTKEVPDIGLSSFDDGDSQANRLG